MSRPVGIHEAPIIERVEHLERRISQDPPELAGKVACCRRRGELEGDPRDPLACLATDRKS